MQDAELLAALLDYGVRKAAEREKIRVPTDQMMMNRNDGKVCYDDDEHELDDDELDDY